MDRITQRSKGGRVFIGKKCERTGQTPLICPEVMKCDAESDAITDRTCPLLVMVDRLAAYEDTGLYPSEIVDMLKERESK